MIRAVRDIYFRSDQAKAYTLLSPALILVIIAMAAPMIVMIITEEICIETQKIDYAMKEIMSVNVEKS